MRPKVTLQKTGPGSRELAAKLAALGRMDVLVGVPESRDERSTTIKGRGKHKRIIYSDINNAQLMFIHTNGSPIMNIPARPVIEPALAANKDSILPQLKQAAQAVLEGAPGQALSHLQAAGIAGRNACIRWFDDPRNGWPPNAPSTIAAKGSSHPLVDTGQLKRSITYVVTEK